MLGGGRGGGRQGAENVVEGEGRAIWNGHEQDGGLQEASQGATGTVDDQTTHKQRPRAKPHVTGVLLRTWAERGA